MTFLDNTVNLESGYPTSTPSKNAVCVSGKREATGSKIELRSVLHSNTIAFEITDGKKVWHCEKKLGELLWGIHVLAVTVQRKL